MKKSFRVPVIILILSASLIWGCKKENDNNVPLVEVDLYLYTTNPAFLNLTTVGGWVYVNGGVRGILVYRKSSTEFMAYDRNCTYQPNEACATVHVDASNIIAVDTCCGSQFSIVDGTVLNGPAGFPLKTYNTTFDGTVVHIYN